MAKNAWAPTIENVCKFRDYMRTVTAQDLTNPDQVSLKTIEKIVAGKMSKKRRM